MRTILAIDPGPKKSAYLFLRDDLEVGDHGHIDNEELANLIRDTSGFLSVACEGLACYGMPVGKETFETAYWIGRFWQISINRGILQTWQLVFRPDVKLFLCRNSRAKDANVRMAIIDRFPAYGGGKIPQIGVKKKPGPLFGVSKHAWSALAVALYHQHNNIGNTNA